MGKSAKNFKRPTKKEKDHKKDESNRIGEGVQKKKGSVEQALGKAIRDKKKTTREEAKKSSKDYVELLFGKKEGAAAPSKE